MHIDHTGIEGYVYGAIQPSSFLEITKIHNVGDNAVNNIKQFERYLAVTHEHSIFEGGHSQADESAPASLLVAILDGLNHLCGDKRFTPIKIITDGEKTTYAIPTLSPQLVIENLNSILKFFMDHNWYYTRDDFDQLIENRLNKCRQYLVGGTNSINFITAAAERRIPFKVFSKLYLIFGYGSGSSIFRSSMTMDDGAVGILLAKSKIDTNRLLSMSGFPVAPQYTVNSQNEAIDIAYQMGYPVVLKPSNQDQGRGVTSNIMNAHALANTYEAINQTYKNLVLEKHIYGDGYRVYILNDEVVRVRRLKAAHVVGDGENTIKQLIDLENSSPRRNSIESTMKKIAIDDASQELLKNQGYTLETIPQKDIEVTLASTTNLSRGGVSDDFFEELHEDNAELCIKANRLFGLHCSGIDLISDDASVSWRENNTIICEINAQPQIGSDEKVAMHDDMITQSLGKFPTIGLHIFADDEAGSKHMNLYDKSADEISVKLRVSDILKQGCPVQYFDTLEISEGVLMEDRHKLEQILVSVKPNFKP